MIPSSAAGPGAPGGWPGPGGATVEWSPRAGLVADLALLSPAEQARAAAFRPPLGEAWAAARCWVRRRLASRWQGDPAGLEIGVGDHGRPVFVHPAIPEGLDVNVSHTDGVIVLALGWGRVGVDVEDPPPAGEDLVALARVVGTAAEVAELAAVRPGERAAAFQRWWVRKEAVLKGQGSGFLADPRQVHVGITAAVPPRPWVVRDLGALPPPSGPWLALALDHEPASVHVGRAPV